jgi:hypothetical protein
VVPTAAFRLLFGLVILRHDRRWLVHVAVTANPTADWIARQISEALSLGHGAQIPRPRPRRHLRKGIQATGQGNGHQGSPHSPPVALAKRTRRALDRIDPTRMFGPSDHFRRGASVPRAPGLCQLLQRHPHALVPRQRRSTPSSDPTKRPDPIHPPHRWSAPVFDPDLIFDRDIRKRDGQLDK